VKQDYDEAGRLYKIASDKGHALAIYALGVMYKHGEGVKQDYDEAGRLYKIAADKGDADATYALGVMYKHGEGVKQDYHEAIGAAFPGDVAGDPMESLSRNSAVETLSRLWRVTSPTEETELESMLASPSSSPSSKEMSP